MKKEAAYNTCRKKMPSASDKVIQKRSHCGPWKKERVIIKERREDDEDEGMGAPLAGTEAWLRWISARPSFK